MGFLKSQVLFSPVEGVVTLNGKPVVGAEVMQVVEWTVKDAPPGNTTKTDAQGRFAFPVVEGASLAAQLLPMRPNIRQTIILKTNDKDFNIYRLHKSNYDLYGENENKPLLLQCEISLNPDHHGVVYGVCRFI